MNKPIGNDEEVLVITGNNSGRLKCGYHFFNPMNFHQDGIIKKILFDAEGDLVVMAQEGDGSGKIFYVIYHNACIIRSV